MCRILVAPEMLQYAIQVLDSMYINNELDEGNRILIWEQSYPAVCQCLSQAGIDFDVI